MELRRQDKTMLLIGLIIIALVILNSLVFFFRLDLTENKAYTISPVSRDLVSKLDEPVRLTYYVSGKLRNQISQIQGIADILYEYARVSNGKVEVSIIDTDGKEEQLRPEDYGIQAQPFQVVEKNQETNAMVYTGIVISYLNSTKSLPVVTNPASIEYDLTSAIRGLVSKKTRVAGILNGGSGADVTSRYTMLASILQKTAEVRNLTKGEAIPADVDALFVFGADGLTPIDAWNIDQFLMSGKGVMMGLDTVTVNLASNWQTAPVPHSMVNDLLDAYGVVLGQGWVLDDSCRNIPYNQRVGQATIQRYLPYPAWVAVTGKTLNQANPVSARAGGLDLLWASPVSLKDPQSGEILATSSPNAWVMKDATLADPNMILTQQRQKHANPSPDFGKPIGLAVLRTHKIDSFFQGKDTKNLIPGKILQPAINSVNDGRLIVLGDGDFASDLYQNLAQNGLVGNGENVVFLQNIFEYLSNDTAMLQLRTRDIWDTRLSNIADPSTRDALGTMALIINAVLVPLGLVLYGLVRTIRRRRARAMEV